MLGVYTANAQVATVTTAKTLMYLTAPADAVCEILNARVSIVDVDTNEQMECSLSMIATLGTPTATASTETKHENGSPAAGATVFHNVTASEPTYDADDVDRQGVASLSGYEFDPVPESRIYVSPSDNIGLRLRSTIASSTVNVSITWREIGG